MGALWPVSDLASARLSVAFYQGLFRGQPVGEALLDARRTVRVAQPEDPSWAAFVLYGDPGWQPCPRPETASYLATALAVDFRSGEDETASWSPGLRDASAAARRYGGRVWNLGLGGLLATFGVPDTEEDQAERAARAALAIREIAAKSAMVMCIGLETSTVVIHAATGAAADELLLGPAATEALRLSREAPAGAILVGAGFRQLLAGRGEWVDAETGARILVGLLPEQAAARNLPLIGREEELASLLGHWRRCQERRQRQIVGLVGEAGIGKTRLLAVLRQEVSPVRWLGSRCPSYLRAEPFALLRALLREALGLSRDASPAPWREALAPLLTDPSDVTLIEQALGLQNFLPENRDVPETVRRAQLVSALRNLLARATADEPIVIAIDDAEQADEASLDILTQLMDSLEALPILWLACYRREWLPPWGNKRRSHIVDLDELVPADRVHLLKSCCPIRPRPSSRRCSPGAAETPSTWKSWRTPWARVMTPPRCRVLFG